MPLKPAKILPCAGDSPVSDTSFDSGASTTSQTPQIEKDFSSDALASPLHQRTLKAEHDDDTLACHITLVMEESIATAWGKTKLVIDRSLLERKVQLTIKLLRACHFCSDDIVLCFAYASSYASRVFPLMAGLLGNAEVVHILILLVFLAHSFMFDETCPMREWHKHIFRKYCTLKKMDTALFSVFSMLEFQLLVSSEDEVKYLQLILQKET